MKFYEVDLSSERKHELLFMRKKIIVQLFYGSISAVCIGRYYAVGYFNIYLFQNAEVSALFNNQEKKCYINPIIFHNIQ